MIFIIIDFVRFVLRHGGRCLGLAARETSESSCCSSFLFPLGYCPIPFIPLEVHRAQFVCVLC